MKAVTQYYVSAEGNDNASGTSESQAWKSPSVIREKDFKPGDSILFRKGDYFRTGWNIGLDASQGGHQGYPIKLDAYGSGPYPVLEADNPETFCGVELSRPYLELWHLEVRSQKNGIVASNAPGSVVKEAVVRSCPGHGIQVSRLYGASAGIVVENNQVYDCGGSGISLTTERNLKCRFNLVRGNCKDVEAPANDLDMNYTAGVKVFGKYGGSGVVLEHNVCEFNGNGTQTDAGIEQIAKGHGLWVDTVDPGSVLVQFNVCRHNELSGMMIELSERIDVYSNRCYTNGANNSTLPNKAGIVIFRGANKCRTKFNVCFDNPFQLMVFGYPGLGEEGLSQICEENIFEENTLLSYHGQEAYRCEPPCDPAKQMRVNEVEEGI